MSHFKSFSTTWMPIPRFPPVITATLFGNLISSKSGKTLKNDLRERKTSSKVTQLILLRRLRNKSSFCDRSPHRIVFTSNLNSHQDFGNSLVVRKKKKSKSGWTRTAKTMSSMTVITDKLFDFLENFKRPSDTREASSETEVGSQLDIQDNVKRFQLKTDDRNSC